MNAIYRLSSAEEVDSKIIEAIKATFHSKPITITVEESKVRPENYAEEMEALLLSGPTFTEEQIEAIYGATEAINKWRTI